MSTRNDRSSGHERKSSTAFRIRDRGGSYERDEDSAQVKLLALFVIPLLLLMVWAFAQS